jgi:hypothetical protein
MTVICQGINNIKYLQLKFNKMGLLDFFKKNDNIQTDVINGIENDENTTNEKIVDRNIFVKNPNQSNSFVDEEENSTAWKRIFSRIRKDYEIEGYNDALSTADVKYRDDNKEILKLNLRVDIEEAEIEIKEYLKELEFHIKSRTKAELNDLVEELESKKVVFEERLEKLTELKTDLNNDSGMPLRIQLAYNRGFNKGMAALTVANVINKNI